MFKTGTVIGSYNMSNAVLLQVTAIRHHCSNMPILISDDCSDPSEFNKIIQIVKVNENVSIWPNPTRIGHAGGDMAAFWKGIIWGDHDNLEVVFKLSQRFIIDVPEWDQRGAEELYRSGLSTLGRSCAFHKFNLRTEAVGMRIDRWHKPEILDHLSPKKLNGLMAEDVLFDDVKHRLDGRICRWDVMSRARPWASPHVIFREANSPQDYRRLAAKFGLPQTDYDTRSSTDTTNYISG
jgi:hypothetical protein